MLRHGWVFILSSGLWVACAGDAPDHLPACMAEAEYAALGSCIEVTESIDPPGLVSELSWSARDAEGKDVMMQRCEPGGEDGSMRVVFEKRWERADDGQLQRSEKREARGDRLKLTSSTCREHDREGHLVRFDQPCGVPAFRFTYDEAGRRLRTERARDGGTSWTVTHRRSYDGAGRPSHDEWWDPDQPNDGVDEDRYGYDAQGRLSSLVRVRYGNDPVEIRYSYAGGDAVAVESSSVDGSGHTWRYTAELAEDGVTELLHIESSEGDAFSAMLTREDGLLTVRSEPPGGAGDTLAELRESDAGELQIVALGGFLPATLTYDTAGRLRVIDNGAEDAEHRRVTAFDYAGPDAYSASVDLHGDGSTDRITRYTGCPPPEQLATIRAQLMQDLATVARLQWASELDARPPPQLQGWGIVGVEPHEVEPIDPLSRYAPESDISPDWETLISLSSITSAGSLP